jgi:HlyD family secretion protein
MSVSTDNPRIRRYRTLVAVVGGLLLVAALLIVFTRSTQHSATVAEANEGRQTDASAPAQVVLSAPGRVEGLTEVVEIGAGVGGVLGEVRVKEGQAVKAGDILARIDRADLQADLVAANNALESARQSRALLKLGSPPAERREAAAKLSAAQASVQEASQQFSNASKLYSEGLISSSDLVKRYQTELAVAQADLDAAQQHYRRVMDGALPEELARADAEVHKAAAVAQAANAQVEQCLVKARTSGTVLRVYMRPGEVYSPQFPRPIVSMADTSRLRVRVEVDERDIALVFPGQRTLVLVDAYPGAQFTGTVSHIEPLMGRKKVRSGDPAEKSDRDVLEALIDLDQSKFQLLVGLRVIVQFLARQAAR